MRVAPHPPTGFATSSRAASSPSFPASAWPWAGALVVAGVLLGHLRACVALTGGHFTYVLDDSYIELAMSRSLALHGSWSLNGTGFEPAASSPLWTALLALASRLVGPHELLPFALNLVAGLGLLFVADACLRTSVPGPAARAAVATAIVLLAPVTAFAVTGMEHGLEALVGLALAWVGARRVFAGPHGGTDVAGAAGLGVLAALATLTRFDCLALLVPLAVVAVWRRRWLDGAALAAGAAAAFALYGGLATAHGGFWLPNSVLIKSRLGLWRAAHFDWGSYFGRLPHLLFAPRNAHFLVLFALAALLVRPAPGRDTPAARAGRGLLALLVPAVLLTFQFGDVGSFFRYESWLVPIALTALVAALAPHLAALPEGWASAARPRAAATALATALFLALLGVRAWHAAEWGPLASRNIYEQQRQMGRFVHDELPGRTVAVSDVGAVSWFGHARVLDLAGLGSMEVARARLADRSNSAWLARYCDEHGADAALLYESWLRGRGGVPPSWRALTRWVLRDNYVADGDTVTVYATRAASVPFLRAALDRFEPTLPPRVGVLRVGDR